MYGRIVAILLLLLVQSISGRPPRGRSTYGRRHPYYGPTDYHRRFPPFSRRPFSTTTQPTTTPENSIISEEDDKRATDFGIKIPPDECIISWDQFKENVPGRNYAAVYDIDGDDHVFLGGIRTGHLHFTIVSDSSIRRESSFWVDTFNTCGYFFGVEERADPYKAIFTPLTGNSVMFPGRRDFVVSSDPSKYIFYFFCYDFDERREDRCLTGLVLLGVKDDREWPKDGDGLARGKIQLNDIPWGELEETMKKCFFQQFVDDTYPQVSWTWKGPGIYPLRSSWIGCPCQSNNRSLTDALAILNCNFSDVSILKTSDLDFASTFRTYRDTL